MKLSIVIPAYNEERRIPAMLEAYAPFFADRFGSECELVVVVNGSTDRTDEVARSFGSRWPQIRVLVEPARIGKGGAVMLGMRAARGDLIGFADADGSTPPAAFLDLVEHIGDAGGIIGSRYLPGADVNPRQSIQRRIASRIFNRLVRLLFRIRISDTQCGAKVFTREAAQTILPRLGVTRWAFDVDLLFQLRRAGFRVIERPTTWHDVHGSQVRIGRTGFEMFIAVVRLRLMYSRLRFIVWIYDHTIGRIAHISQ